MLEVGAVPETPSSGPSVVCSSLPSLQFSLPFPPGQSFCPLPGAPEFWERKPKQGLRQMQLQLGPQLEVLEAEGGGEDWPGEEREDGTQRAPGLPVPMEASVSSSQTLS